MSFSTELIRWYEENGRTLPWRGIDDPYRIWLSEIILQQTRIAQGMSYYLHFVERYPTVASLAAASEEEVLKSWQGLGYYSRARNLHAAARQIMEQYDGKFPDSYDGILSLKGVGRYTAAAIASFAYRLPYPVIDGNVYRVVSRVFDIDTPIGTDAAYKVFEQQLRKVMDLERPDIFNQAIMDFGSTYCTPTGCDCAGCIFADRCQAFRRGKVEMLPVKAEGAKVRDRYFYYYDIEWEADGQWMRLLRQRSAKDIWRGLYELPLLESRHALSEKELTKQTREMLRRYSEKKPLRVDPPVTMVHKLTHQTLHATFIHAILAEVRCPDDEASRPTSREETKKAPVSRLIDKYLSTMCKNSYPAE